MKEGSSFSDRARVIKYEPQENEDKMKDNLMKWTANFRIEKYNSQESYKKGIPDEIQTVKGNTATTKGLFTLWCLAQGLSTSSTVTYDGVTISGVYPLNQANTYIGVGNGTATASASDTALFGDTQTFVQCESGFPVIDQANPNTLQVKATFGPSTGNHEWNEWTIANGNPSNVPAGHDSNSVVLFNRRVETMGTKAQNATWVIIADLIISPSAT